MTPLSANHRHRALALRWVLAALLSATSIGVAAATIQAGAATAGKETATLLAPITPPGATVPGIGKLDGVTGEAAVAELEGGRWTTACQIAAAVLAGQVPDTNALGVFAVCAAVRDDRSAAQSALTRLQGAGTAAYFRLLTEGILQLQDKAPDKALASFRAALQARPGDPLAQYFEGEALYARKQPAAAIAAFKTALKTWPQFAPAMTASARLLSGPKASPAELKEAVALAEKATKIEPMNRGYWKLLADLSRRTGDEGRANAIELQYLKPRLPPVPK